MRFSRETQSLATAMLLALSSIAAADPPTTQQIREWLDRSIPDAQILDNQDPETRKHHTEESKKYSGPDWNRPYYSFDSDKAIGVFLKNREPGYLVEAIGQGGRNSMWRVLLIRSKELEVCELPRIGSIGSVLDLDGNGVSEILVESVGSGGGSTYGVRYLIQLDGCTPVVLRSGKFNNNNGEWGTEDARYFRNETEWSFSDLNQDGVLDLTETKTTEVGRDGQPPIVERKSAGYIFTANTFVRVLE